MYECCRAIIQRIGDFDTIGLVVDIWSVIPAESAGVDGATPFITAFVYGYKLAFKTPGDDFGVEVVADGLDGLGIGADGLDAAAPVTTPFGVNGLCFCLRDICAY